MPFSSQNQHKDKLIGSLLQENKKLLGKLATLVQKRPSYVPGRFGAQFAPAHSAFNQKILGPNLLRLSIKRL